jgi:hypothetical protein
MDVEKFLDDLAEEMKKLEAEMRGEAFFRDLLSRPENVCLSNLACGIADAGRSAGEERVEAGRGFS